MGAPKSLKSEYGQHSVLLETHSRSNAETGATSSREFPLDKLGENSAFLDLIRREAVSSIHSQEATLEEVFIKTTGAQLK